MTQYYIAAIWWPDGWEPTDPCDVPSCIRPAGDAPPTGPAMTYDQAVATLRGLNRQNMDRPGAIWHVIAAMAEETAPPVPGDAVDDFQRRVVRPREGGPGDCSHCPAHHLPCAQEGR